VSTTAEGSQEEGVGVATQGPHICWQWRTTVRWDRTPVVTTKLARRPAWEVPTKLAMRPAWEVMANRFELPR
jgi:hypothetical protein